MKNMLKKCSHRLDKSYLYILIGIAVALIIGLVLNFGSHYTGYVSQAGAVEHLYVQSIMIYLSDTTSAFILIMVVVAAMVARTNDIRHYTNMGIKRTENLVMTVVQGLVMIAAFMLVFVMNFFISKAIGFGMYKDVVIFDSLYIGVNMSDFLQNLAILFLAGLAIYFAVSFIWRLYAADKMVGGTIAVLVPSLVVTIGLMLYKITNELSEYLFSNEGQMVVFGVLAAISLAGYVAIELKGEVHP